MNNVTQVGDIGGFLGAIGIIVFGLAQQDAYLFGMWLGIFICSTSGALISLGMADLNGRGGWYTAWFLSVRILAAMALTMSVVRGIDHFLPNVGPNITIALVAFGISCDFVRAKIVKAAEWALSYALKKRLGE